MLYPAFIPPSNPKLTDPAYPSTSDISYAVWLKHFANQLPALTTRYQLTPDDIADVKQLNLELIAWLISCMLQATEAIQQATAVIRPPATPAPAKLPAPQHLFDRVAALMQRVQHHPAYNPADGAALGLVKPLPTLGKLHLPMPKLRVPQLLAPGTAYVLKWVNRRDTTIELEVCRDGHTWLPLRPTEKKHYEDAWPQPPRLAEWRYRARYRWHDLPAGKWCRPLVVRVGPS